MTDLEFGSYNDLVVANIFGPHKTSRKITWHSPDGKTHNQIDYIMVKKQLTKKSRKAMKKSKGNWIGNQCQNIDDCLKNNNKKAYELVQDLTGTKQEKTTTIQDKGGTCLTENEDILKRWTEYCSELYNYRAPGDPEVH